MNRNLDYGASKRLASEVCMQSQYSIDATQHRPETTRLWQVTSAPTVPIAAAVVVFRVTIGILHPIGLLASTCGGVWVGW